VEAAQHSHPPCVNVYCGLTYYGMADPHFVAGTTGLAHDYQTQTGTRAKNITAQEYPDVLQQTLLPDGQAMFTRQGVYFWVFQQDNDPTHRAANGIVRQWSLQQPSTCELLAPWPPHSPDLNPIENVWSWVQAEVDKLGCATLEEFKAAVVNTLASVPLQMCRNLVNSMPRRLALVVENEGGRTGY
jgi:hypothetical protein